MREIEIGNKKYTIDTSQVTIGDYFDAVDCLENSDMAVKASAFNAILRKCLGEQIYSIPIANYSYLISCVVGAMMEPISTDAISDEVDEILKRSEESNK